MYENMKPRDAAKIFDRLEMSVLLEVASQIKPRTMSEIMAQMSARHGRTIDRRTRKPGQGGGEAGRRTAEDRRSADPVNSGNSTSPKFRRDAG